MYIRYAMGYDARSYDARPSVRHSVDYGLYVPMFSNSAYRRNKYKHPIIHTRHTNTKTKKLLSTTAANVIFPQQVRLDAACTTQLAAGPVGGS